MLPVLPEAEKISLRDSLGPGPMSTSAHLLPQQSGGVGGYLVLMGEETEVQGGRVTQAGSGEVFGPQFHSLPRPPLSAPQGLVLQSERGALRTGSQRECESALSEHHDVQGRL